MQNLISYPFKEPLRINYFPLLTDIFNNKPVSEKFNQWKNHSQEINNHLKSAAEIEAEFILRAHESDANHVSGKTANTVRNGLEKEELVLSIDTFSMNLPDYMEENY